MRGSIQSSKGTLIEFFAEFDDGKMLTVHPLKTNAAVLLLNRRAQSDLLMGDYEGSESVLAIDHDGKVVGAYDAPGQVASIQHSVLYPDGSHWTGPVLVGEESRVDYLVLTEEGLGLLRDSSGFDFADDSEPEPPTVLVKYSGSGSGSLCGSHHCGRICHSLDKFIEDGVS